MARSQHPDEVILDWLDGPVRVALLTLNRPEHRNPVSESVLAELHVTLERLVTSEMPRAIVITGAGDAFSAGGDLKGYRKLFADRHAFAAFLQRFSDVCELLESCECLTVAMVNGACVAGGLELALACDVIVMSESAKIGDGHLRFSQLPGAGGSQRLIRAIGHQRARWWLLTGKLFDARVAFEIGLAADVVPASQLRDRTLFIIGEILRASPLAFAEMKKLLQFSGQESLREGIKHEAEAAFKYASQSHDATEGLAAFVDRRAARYLGR